jgi:hypothetical protein
VKYTRNGEQNIDESRESPSLSLLEDERWGAKSRKRGGFGTMLTHGWNIALGAAAALVLGVSGAAANGLKDRYQVAPDAKAWVAFSGFDAVKDASYAFQGIILSANRDISRDGVVFRLYGSHTDYEYDTEGVPGGRVDGDAWQGDAMVGYKISRGLWWAAGYIGVDYQDHDLTPDDLENPVSGSEVGFKVAADVATLRQGTPLYFALNGQYSTAFDSYWARARVGINHNRFTFGPEGLAMGNDAFDAQRVGAFLTFDVELSRSMPVEITLSGGYQFVSESDDNGGGISDGGAIGSGGGEGAYGGVVFLFVF